MTTGELGQPSWPCAWQLFLRFHSGSMSCLGKTNKVYCIKNLIFAPRKQKDHQYSKELFAKLTPDEGQLLSVHRKLVNAAYERTAQFLDDRNKQFSKDLPRTNNDQNKHILLACKNCTQEAASVHNRRTDRAGTSTAESAVRRVWCNQGLSVLLMGTGCRGYW